MAQISSRDSSEKIQKITIATILIGRAQRFDADGSGTLDGEEIEDMLRQIYGGEMDFGSKRARVMLRDLNPENREPARSFNEHADTSMSTRQRITRSKRYAPFPLH